MFELSIACKYLIPRWKQLSVSIITLISTLVIALVVWLIVVFFSVKEGLENGWIDKITALTAPIRILPTDRYYHSYYYLADTISANSNYNTKTIEEKKSSPNADPYDPTQDEELPPHWPAPDKDRQGNVKDLVKLAFASASSISGIDHLQVSDFETTVANLHLPHPHSSRSEEVPTQFIEYPSFIGSFDADTIPITKTLLPPSPADNQRLLRLPLNDITQLPIATTNATGIVMPTSSLGDPILLPKGFREQGVLIGDQGYLSYYSPTPSSLQEQQIPIIVSGFYDPGIIPMGGKYILASRDLTSLIRASYGQEDAHFSNGINVRFQQIGDAPIVKAKLQQALEKAGIAPYWQIETYQEYEFSKDIIQQLQSEKNLFSLISLIIIIVACSNIISMLIILVNDKKLEIGILRSMGASSASIATIFGICGLVMGTIGSLVGILAAILTLRYVNELVGWISRLQGHDLFNPIFYGSTLPTDLSFEALMFVLMTTVAVSLVAGIVPACKASMMRPSAILRAE